MRFGVLRAVFGVSVALGFGGAGCGGATSLPPAGSEGTGGGASSGGGSGNGGSAADHLCDQYCDAAMKDCTGGFAVYASRDICLEVCAALPPGKAGDQSTNTVQCRMTMLKNAGRTGGAGTFCPGAGPGGDGACGSNCDGLCAIAKDVCPNEKFTANCAVECADLYDAGGYNVTHQSGYDRQCRLYHVSAATLDPAIHCPHVGGIGPCAPTLL